MRSSPTRLQQSKWVTHGLRWGGIAGLTVSVALWAFVLLSMTFIKHAGAKSTREFSRAGPLAIGLYGAEATVGEPLEPCDTEITLSSTRVLSPTSHWENALQTAVPGTTFLLHGGTYAATKKLKLNAGQAGQLVTVKPYNCEPVILQGSFKLLSYTVLAGLRIEATGLPTTSLTYVIQVDADDQAALRNLVIRNNTIVGGETDALRINGDVVGLTLTGNQIDGGKAGHDIFVTTEISPVNPALSPDNIIVTNNRLTKVYFRSEKTPSEDMFQVRDARHVIFAHNTCTDGSRMEQCVDIKNMTEPITIQDNLFDGTNLHLDGLGEDPSTGCMVIHETDGHPENHLIEDNYFKNCRTTVIRFATSQEEVTPEHKLENSRGTVRHNLFVNPDSTDDDGLLIWRAEDVLFEHNTMISGTLKLGRGAGLKVDPPITPKNTILKNNIFYQTRIDDNTKAPNFVYTCSYNLLFGITKHGDQLLDCTPSLTSDPHFTALATGDYHLAPDSPACGAGENGTDLGAFPCASDSATNTPTPTNTPTEHSTPQALYLPILTK